MLQLPVLAILCAPLLSHPDGATLYVRPDGGSAEVCDGRTDAAVAGATGRACALARPEDAVAALRGGDRVVLAAGVYHVEALPPLPSGTNARRRTVLTGRPGTALVGGGRAAQVVNLAGASHVDVTCLEITDDAECVENHGGNQKCPENGEQAAVGLAASDASDVILRDLDVHGLARAGLTTLRTRDLTVEDVTVSGNGLVGWQAEAAGATVVRHVNFESNGCAEDRTRRPIGCASRTAGGWGAGLFASPATGVWRIEDSRFAHNTGDGLTLLHDGTGTVTVKGTRSERNGGVGLRLRGELVVEDTVGDARCRAFTGAEETFHVDECSGGGAALAIEPLPGRPVTIRRGAFTGEGQSLLELVVPVRPGQPRDLCKRFLPVVATGTRWEGNGQLLVYRECGGIEGAGPVLDNREAVVRTVRVSGEGP